MLKLCRLTRTTTFTTIHNYNTTNRNLTTVWCSNNTRPTTTTTTTTRRLPWLQHTAHYHQGGDDGGGGDGGGGSLHEIDTQQLGAPRVPDNYPVVPVIPITRSPIYPKFLKLVEVTDKSLIGVLRKQWQRAQPYAGVFLRKGGLFHYAFNTLFPKVVVVFNFFVP